MTKFNDIKKELIDYGFIWREDNKKVNEKTGEEKIYHPGPRVIADVLKDHIVFCTIGNDKRELEKSPLYHYDPDEGLYTTGIKDIEKLILAFDGTTNSRTRKEVIQFLRIESRGVKLTDDSNLIPVGNGIVKLDTMELLPFSAEYVFTTKTATNYNPSAIEPSFNGWKFSDWMKQLASEDKIKYKLLWQMIASVIKGRTGLMYLFVDNGQGRTGKSTLQQLLINLVGSGNYRALKLKQFDNDFLLAQGYGARLLVGDDNDPSGFIDDGSNLKSVVTDEIVLVNPKKMTPFTAKFKAVVIQSMNGLPKFRDKTGGLYRRFRMVYFNHQWPADKASERIKKEYIYNPGLLEWILKKALTIDIKEIANPSESIELVETTRLANDPIAYFVSEYVPQLKSERLPAKFLFNFYLWAMQRENNPQRLSQRKFTNDIRPYMEALGWKYKNNGSVPSVYFNQLDFDLFKSYDPNRGLSAEKLYNVNKEMNRKQGLFDRT